VEVELHTFLPLALEVGEWSASHPGYSWGRSPCTHWTGGWVGCRADLNVAAKKKSLLCLCWKLVPVIQPIALSLYWLSYCGFVDHIVINLI